MPAEIIHFVVFLVEGYSTIIWSFFNKILHSRLACTAYDTIKLSFLGSAVSRIKCDRNWFIARNMRQERDVADPCASVVKSFVSPGLVIRIWPPETGRSLPSCQIKASLAKGPPLRIFETPSL